MFNFFKKNQSSGDLYAPVNGECIDITDVNDPIFSDKILGDGFAVKPDTNIICAPCSGELSMVFATGHAFGIVTNDKREILVHIGIETVNLNGEGFKALKKQNSKIDVGDPVIEINREEIERVGYDLTTMVIMTSEFEREYTKEKLSQHVCKGDKVIHFLKGG